jgi:hypothetical protein
MTTVRPQDGQLVEVLLDGEWMPAVFRECEFDSCFILSDDDYRFIEPLDIPQWRETSATVQISPEDADRIRKRADSFDPMKAGHWTPWQAIAWIVDRGAVDKIRECSETWRLIGPSFPKEGAALRPFRRIWRDSSVETADAHAELLHAFKAGTLTATGIERTTGIRREISSLEWLDLHFSENSTVTELPGLGHLRADVPQLYRNGSNLVMRPEPAFVDVLVRVADVISLWENPVDDSAAQASGAYVDVKHDTLVEFYRNRFGAPGAATNREEMDRAAQLHFGGNIRGKDLVAARREAGAMGRAGRPRESVK